MKEFIVMDNNRTKISTEDLLISNVILTNAVLQLMVTKGIASPNDVVKAVKQESMNITTDKITGNIVLHPSSTWNNLVQRL